MLSTLDNILFMYMRFVMMVNWVFFDSQVAYLCLRKNPGDKLDDGKQISPPVVIHICHINIIFFLGFLGLLFIFVDIARHILTVFLSENVSIITLDLTNPATGNSLELTNKQVADATYFSAMIFFAKT